MYKNPTSGKPVSNLFLVQLLNVSEITSEMSNMFCELVYVSVFKKENDIIMWLQSLLGAFLSMSD